MRAGRRGIVTDLVLLIAAALLPAILLSAYFSYRSVQAERAAIYATALRQARDTAHRADELIGETRALLDGLAQTPTLRGGDPEQIRALLRDVKGGFAYYDDLFAIDPAGRITAAANGLAGEDATAADRAFLQRVAQGNGATVSEVLLSPSSGRPVVVIGKPVRAGDRGGPPIGAVVATVDLIRLQEWLDNRTLPPRTTITVVDNQQGRVLARSLEPERWIGRTIADVPVVRAAIEQDEGIVEGANVDGIARLNGYATAGEVPWTVLVGIPRDTVYAPLERESRLLAARLALAALATIVLAVVGVRRIIRPLRRLTAGADAIAGGDLAHRVAVERHDEVGRLGLAVNHMADELVGSIAALRRAQERLEGAVAQVGRGLTSATEASAVLTPLVDAAAALTRADAGLLVFADTPAPVVSGHLPPLPPGLPEALFRDCEEGLAEDGVVNRPRPTAVARPTLQALGMRECLAVAVRAHGEGLGTLLVFRRAPHPFSEGDERLLRTFADQAAVAIEQTRLRAEASQAAALRELHRLQAEFITTASHELRAPIAAIRGYAEMLLRDDLHLDEAMRRRCLGGIQRQAERLGGQVRAFFDAVRAGEGRLVMRREPVDLAEIAAAVVDGFAASAGLHEFRLRAAPDLPPALADPERVEDVFTNLLDNAVKYSPEGGRIEVTIEVPREPENAASGGGGEGAALAVAVRDEGIGIPAEEQGRIFERFYRLDRLISRHAGGAGLGLYLCRAYIEGMGGRLRVESRPGAGSVFRFTLPVAPVAPGDVAPAAPEEVAP